MADERRLSTDRVSTGVAGLDDVLCGGLPRDRLYLVQGDPGAGKTTLGLQFLLEGERRGERGLYITLSESREEIMAVVASHGWSLGGLALHELSALEQTMQLGVENTLYEAADVELSEVVGVLLDEVRRIKPMRVVFDSLSELRLLAGSALRYRRQVLALKQYFVSNAATVLVLDDRTDEDSDRQVRSLAHGVVTLEQLPVQYGGDRRRLRVAKLRGATFRSGHHDFTLRTGGLCVFPRLVAAEHRGAFLREPLSTGVDGLDALLGGGVDRGTATLVVGPAGTGKSTVAAQVMAAAAARGERVAAFVFEESQGTLVARAEALGIDLRGPLEAGTLSVRHVDPAELAPDEFAYAVRGAVEAGARVVAIDSLTGYFNAMPEARFLTLQLHELLTYLHEKGVVTLLTLAQHGLVGGAIGSPIDVSYLADTVLLIRYFESQGRVRKAISVVKKRTGVHEDAIRELTLAPGALRVGAPLTDFQGVLTGVPTFSGAREDLDRVSRD